MPHQLRLVHKEVGPWPMNTYALVCPSTRQSILIDPGADHETLVAMLDESQPIAIVLTHSHADHVGALEEMLEQLQVPLMTHSSRHGDGLLPSADRHLEMGDIVIVGEHRLIVLHTPGHMQDQICLSIENDNRVIVGDTIFEGGPGKTWSPAGFTTTLNTLRDVVLQWPDDTICYPGHGPHFRLGDKRAAIEAFTGRNHGDFYGDATWDMGR